MSAVSVLPQKHVKLFTTFTTPGLLFLIPPRSVTLSHVFNLSQGINLQETSYMQVYQNCWLTGSIFFSVFTSTQGFQATKRQNVSSKKISSYLVLLTIVNNIEHFHSTSLHVSQIIFYKSNSQAY